MNKRIITLLMAVLLGMTGSFSVHADEHKTMAEISALCEAEAAGKADPDAYFEKCLDEKTSEDEEAESDDDDSKD